MTDFPQPKLPGSNSVTPKPETPNVSRTPLSEFSQKALESNPANATTESPELERKNMDLKLSGAEALNRFASAFRNAANELEGDIPFAPTYIRKAASQLDNAANALRAGDFSDIIESVGSYVKKRPAVVIGVTVLVGFGMVRLLTASRERPANRVQNAASHHKTAA